MFTFKKLLFATIAFFVVDVISIWVRNNYGLMNWISPTTVKFWANDIALLIAWIIYFIEWRRRKNG